MLVAADFAASARYRRDAFGDAIDEGPLIVQFAATNAEDFIAAAAAAKQLGAAAADLNLGCPQLRAKEGGYGAYLADDWDTCVDMIERAAMHFGDAFGITVKIRLQQTHVATVDFAVRLARAGARIVTLHARHRGRTNARRDGAAELECVRHVADALRPLGVPVFSNGNVRCAQDAVSNLAETGAAGVMVAEELLRDPALFDAVRLLLSGDSPEPMRRADLVGAYLDACAACDQNGRLKREDSSSWGKHGVMTRGESRESGGARYSVWWPNIEARSFWTGWRTPRSACPVISYYYYY